MLTLTALRVDVGGFRTAPGLPHPPSTSGVPLAHAKEFGRKGAGGGQLQSQPHLVGSPSFVACSSFPVCPSTSGYWPWNCVCGSDQLLGASVTVLGTCGSLQLKPSLKMMAPMDCLPTGLPAAEATQSSLKEDDLTFVPNPVPCHSHCLHWFNSTSLLTLLHVNCELYSENK